MSRATQCGFTLIELSIVLVIIGLIVGGVLVGQDLIRAAAVRAQITQIEKFNTAANTFFGKYGYLPGDITPTAVTQFGFTGSPIRSGVLGNGDGNGELDGTNGTYASDFAQGGETAYFWEDLSTNSHLIEGSYNTAVGPTYAINCGSASACSPFFPGAKIGNGAFVFVYSGYAANCCASLTGNGPNFFALAIINTIQYYGDADYTAPSLTVSQAYAIDKKMDDGLPTTGNVLAQYPGNGGYTNSGYPGWSVSGPAPSTTCYDTSSGTAAYSVNYQNGTLVNCGISFKMQAGD